VVVPVDEAIGILGGVVVVPVDELIVVQPETRARTTNIANKKTFFMILLTMTSQPYFLLDRLYTPRYSSTKSYYFSKGTGKFTQGKNMPGKLPI
jgi:hypothetical protein